MIIKKNALLSLLFLFIPSIQAIDISGTVKNQANISVANLEVALKSEGFKDTTDSAGTFSIRQITGLTAHHERRRIAAPKLRGNRFIVPVTDGNQKVSITIFDLKGSKVATVIDKVLPEGEHVIPFINDVAMSPASVLIAIVRRGADMARFQLVRMSTGGFLIREYSSGGMPGYSGPGRTAAFPALDSLLFIRRIKIEEKDTVIHEYSIPITQWTDKFEVTLDLIPYETVEWGKAQLGRSDETVGKELNEQKIYPYDLYRYSKGTAWCSEFYTYCLRIAGYPLGDDAGSSTSPHWMVNAWNTLITWFKNNAEYVEKSQIAAQNYVPKPGDFIQLNEHTAMVRYVQGTTLYCLDGNYGDKVALVNRGNYATFSGLNGYGRRSGITGNSYKSIAAR